MKINKLNVVNLFSPFRAPHKGVLQGFIIALRAKNLQKDGE